MKDSFKGVWVPRSLIERCGHKLAVKLAAFHLGVYSLSNPDQNKAVDLGLLIPLKYSQDQIISILKKKIPQKLNIDLSLISSCSWCQCTTVCIHSHHYPIPKAKGGKITISICPNCHYEFHQLENKYIFSLIEPYSSEIDMVVGVK